jgi:bifunctional non-homologous end joining protein LigD
MIDLDPAPGVGFTAVRTAAREAGARLRDAGLVTDAMVTGSRGIHVVCPLRRGPSFTEAHRFTRAVAPYGVRPQPGGPVAMPIHWEELSDRRLRPDRWTVATAPGRLRDDGDAWRGIARHARNLPRLGSG